MTMVFFQVQRFRGGEASTAVAFRAILYASETVSSVENQDSSLDRMMIFE